MLSIPDWIITVTVTGTLLLGGLWLGWRLLRKQLGRWLLGFLMKRATFVDDEQEMTIGPLTLTDSAGTQTTYLVRFQARMTDPVKALDQMSSLEPTMRDLSEKTARSFSGSDPEQLLPELEQDLQHLGDTMGFEINDVHFIETSPEQIQQMTVDDPNPEHPH